MSLGKLARVIFGKKYFPVLGRAYRSFFWDVRKIVLSFPEMEDNAHLLDIGGGDGYLLNAVFKRFPDIRVTMIDIADDIGTALKPEYHNRVKILPRTSISDYKKMVGAERVDYVLLCSVIHHIPKSERVPFFQDIKEMLGGNNPTIIIIEVQPGNFTAWLGYISDRFISGCRDVELISREDLILMIRSVFPKMKYRETDLIENKHSNYCLLITDTHE